MQMVNLEQYKVSEKFENVKKNQNMVKITTEAFLNIFIDKVHKEENQDGYYLSIYITLHINQYLMNIASVFAYQLSMHCFD